MMACMTSGAATCYGNVNTPWDLSFFSVCIAHQLVMHCPSVSDGCQGAGHDEEQRAAKSGLLNGKFNNGSVLSYCVGGYPVFLGNASKLGIEDST